LSQATATCATFKGAFHTAFLLSISIQISSKEAKSSSRKKNSKTLEGIGVLAGIYARNGV
jgi:hypothetical protein